MDERRLAAAKNFALAREESRQNKNPSTAYPVAVCASCQTTGLRRYHPKSHSVNKFLFHNTMHSSEESNTTLQHMEPKRLDW